MLLSPTYINILNMSVPIQFFLRMFTHCTLFLATHSVILMMFVRSVLYSRILAHPLCQISWGTKQDSVIETDLGAVIQDSHSQVDVEMLTEAADVNSMYEDALFNLKNRKPLPPKSDIIVSNLEKEQIAKDYYANVRTNVSTLVNCLLLRR
jgi:chitin synthase